MKSKNLVSLSVAFVFLVLSATGLLIYFAQGSHAVEHVHAWFGILFVGAAIFHIINNWSSIVGYTKDRRTGGIRREVWIPVLVAVVFTAGIAADLPVFDKLANAGKVAFGRKKPQRDGPLSLTAVDSVARSTEASYAKALSAGDKAALSAVYAPNAALWNEEGTAVSETDKTTKPQVNAANGLTQNEVERAEAIDDNVILVHGTLTNITKTEASVYTHVLKRQDGKWRIVAGQLARPSAGFNESTAAN